MDKRTEKMLVKVSSLIEKARECERKAEAMLSEALPEGTLVTFRSENMKNNANGVVESTGVHHYPEVTITNTFTGKIRRIAPDAIKGVCRPPC
jgi:hypothetical protein